MSDVEAPPAPRRSRRRPVVIAVIVVILVAALAYVFTRLSTGSPHAAAPSPSASSSGPPVPAPSPFPCTLTPLTTPKGVDINQLAVDPTGHFIVNNIPVVLWSNGKPAVLDTGDRVVAVAVNAQGVVIGNETTDAWVYRAGRRTPLPKLAGYSGTVANGINAAGDIVGRAFNRTGPWAAVIWPASAPRTVRQLTAPADPHGAEAYGINDAGIVVGTSGDGRLAYVWGADGQGRALPNPPRTTKGKAFAISGDWVAGEVAPVPDPKNFAVAARWNLATGESTVFTGQTFPAYGVTDFGEVLVPFTNPANLVDPASDVIIGTTAHRLPGAKTAGSRAGKAVYANAITADGTVVVGSLNDKHSNEPVVWHCGGR